MPLKHDKGIKIQFPDDIREALEKAKVDSKASSLGEIVRLAVNEYLQNRGFL